MNPVACRFGLGKSHKLLPVDGARWWQTLTAQCRFEGRLPLALLSATRRHLSFCLMLRCSFDWYFRFEVIQFQVCLLCCLFVSYHWGMVSVIYLCGFWLSAVMINSRMFDPSAVLLTLFSASCPSGRFLGMGGTSRRASSRPFHLLRLRWRSNWIYTPPQITLLLQVFIETYFPQSLTAPDKEKSSSNHHFSRASY